MIGSSYVRANHKSMYDVMRTMQSLEDRILSYIYFLNMKYFIDSISLAKLCYKMQRSVRAVKPDADILVAKGFLNVYHQGEGVSYTISKEGIDHVEHKDLMRMRGLVVGFAEGP